MTPIILICGEAGSGKDTVGSLIQKHTSSLSLAQADSMKIFARDVFCFTDDQLFGPSASRNKEDERFNDPELWKAVDYKMRAKLDKFLSTWFDPVYPPQEALPIFFKWFTDLRNSHVKFSGEVVRTLTPRTMLQTLGTEAGRNVDLDMWSNYALRTARQLLLGGLGYLNTVGTFIDPTRGIPDFVLITDGRFANEMLNVLKINGITLRIINPKPSADRQAVERSGVAGHVSEQGLKQIPGHWYTHTIVNDKSKGLEHLEREVLKFLSGITTQSLR